ncbi:hypothetical protein [Ulvibacterium sp.]|uniref:hypothetical protein n=1 Tax=Ulvibacterium sp. TaxID=2665914 RepID=UPI00263851B6|nr:hypothetical protein [Ulvibacterium sp.]
MKTRISILLLLVTTVQYITAQKMDPQKMADYQTKIMTEELELNESQKKRVTELNLEFSKKQAELMNREGSMFSKMGDVKRIGKEKNAAMEEILTKEQMEKYEDHIQPQMRKHMRQKMKG